MKRKKYYGRHTLRLHTVLVREHSDSTVVPEELFLTKEEFENLCIFQQYDLLDRNVTLLHL